MPKPEKLHKKTTLHPTYFTASFLSSVVAVVLKNKLQKTFFGLAALLSLAGIYSLWKEKRIAKGLRPVTNFVSGFWKQALPLVTQEPAQSSTLHQLKQ
jgi:hypothetical protein